MSWLYWAVPLMVVFGLILLSPLWFGALRNRRHEEDEARTVAHNRRVLAGRRRAPAGGPGTSMGRARAGSRI